jgi:hypothetical protein
MSRDDIIRMAREAHHELVTQDYPGHLGQLDPWTLRLLERFAALVAAQERESYEHTLALQQRSYEREIEIEVEAEREACAKVAKETVCDMHLGTGIKIYGTRAAAAIRARGRV